MSLFQEMFHKEPKLHFMVPPPFPPSPVADLRPCLADDKPAVFHRWVDVDKGLLRINAYVLPPEQDALHRRFVDDGIIPSCCSMEALRSTLALVEYPDGSVGQVKPELIQFLDRGDDSMG